MYAPYCNKIEVVNLLLDYNACINTLCCDGWPSLMIAMYYLNKYNGKTIRQIIFNINLESKGLTALLIALKCLKVNLFDAVKLLLDDATIKLLLEYDGHINRIMGCKGDKTTQLNQDILLLNAKP